MDAGTAVKILEGKVLDAINTSGLHPVVVRLVLLNVIHAVEDKERELAAAAEKEALDGRHPDVQK